MYALARERPIDMIPVIWPWARRMRKKNAKMIPAVIRICGPHTSRKPVSRVLKRTPESRINSRSSSAGGIGLVVWNLPPRVNSPVIRPVVFSYSASFTSPSLSRSMKVP
ncbi:MAG: hypothetical protein KatS3mg008_2092 [Acidimicrobiales bacterium]|nr:MAG: hypothetical protein KatS3mg008_2092 [Acidimicrobiales bacterium]